jgi:hypothetical protein
MGFHAVSYIKCKDLYKIFVLILSCVWRQTTDRFWIDDQIYWTLWYSSWLYFTVHCYTRMHAHARVRVTSSLPLLGSGRHSPSSGFPNCLRPQYQHLTATAHSDWAQTATQNQKLESKLGYDSQSVGQLVLVSSTDLGPKTIFLLLSDNCGFVDVRCPLW